jgi:HPt (histidine-containing phosphotransfer) domain-containing protein
LKLAPVEAPDESEVLDPTIINGLKELREPGQPDPLAELIQLFLRDARPRLDRMEAAANTGDWPQLAAVTHALKGSASNLGARRLAALCATLEKRAKAGDGENARRTLPDVQAEFGMVEKFLQRELSR